MSADIYSTQLVQIHEDLLAIIVCLLALQATLTARLPLTQDSTRLRVALQP